MLVHRAFRHKAAFTSVQERQARQFAGCKRLIYNSALEQRSLGYQVTGKSMGYKRQTYFLKGVKASPEFAFLRDAPAHVLQQAMADLDKAFGNFFSGRGAYPKPRKRGVRDGFRYPDPDPKQIGRNDPARHGQVRLPKLGWVSVHNAYPRLRRRQRLFEGELKTVSVTREADGWYVSFNCEVEMRDPVMPVGVPIGLDVGIANSATTSTGEQYHLPVISKAEWAKVGRLQTDVNRCQKGSRNRDRAVRRLAKYRRRLMLRKHDALHKLTTRLTREHPFIAVEALRIANMSASAKGTVEAPGTKVAQKAGLNKAILDQCWGEMFRQLAYKSEWSGGVVRQVRAQYSSQECSACSHVAKENRDSQAVFQCVNCGFTCHADTNAARIILTRGLQDQAALEAAQVAEAQAEASAAAAAMKDDGSAGGTPVPVGCEEAARRACEDVVSLKNPETPRPSRKTRPRGRATQTRVVAVLT